MGNLTITTNEEILKKARMRALQEGTSVNAVLREFLEIYAGARTQHIEEIKGLLQLSKNSGARRGNSQWSRDDLHERS